ncbi:sugar phosphate isomerase/epimerase family protein [Paenibacillus sp. FJAT-27812]|uniref:sugar phosphate isomerase/epimerase family protein n=1 Tax=Paenibacillus sp. FJAT-27812 TaxID=1684143 RepID=UPI0006A76DCA|nr:sugar phosphate isomerase/epimerase [Paenibacillus sp. FJAT-27812]
MESVYAMDTFFYNSLGHYPFEVRCEMLRELGYDAAYLTLWDEQAWTDLEKLPQVKDDYGLDIAAVYAVLDVTLPKEHTEAAKIVAMLETIQGCSRVELALTMGDSRYVPSDPDGDRLALEWLSYLLQIAERRGIQISLYHHVFFWLERWEDAHRLISKLSHPLLGMTFSSFHWYAVDGTKLNEAVSACLPYLHAVNICGSRKLPPGGLPASIECIDQGELDLFGFLAALKKHGYCGPLGFQGYGMGGDTYSHLERNKKALKLIEDRLAKHPNWLLA